MLFLTILFSITPAKAALSSFVIPGSGDILLGDKKRGSCFMLAEAAIWLTYFNKNSAADKLDSRAKNFAYYYASANSAIEDDDYFRAMEDFLTNLDYNETVKEEARRLYPDTLNTEVMQERIEQRKEYIEENSYIGSSSWEWQSRETADVFREMRRDKRATLQTASNMIGLAVANRTISFFTTYFFGKRVSVEIKQNEIEMGFRF
jgi:hypothetical protein